MITRRWKTVVGRSSRNHGLRAGASILRRRLKARIIIRLMSSLGIAKDVVVFVNFILINQKQYSGREVREKLQLSSSDFEIVKEGNSYIFVTKGCGHGVGLSQYGAQGMAKEGYNYQAILKHYYQGVEISKNKE